MKISSIAWAAAAVLPLAVTLSFGQGLTTSPPAETLERPAAVPHSSGSGTAPEGIGSTGWTGGSRSQSANGKTAAPQTSEDADQQPWVATGADLKGPPHRFSGANTPE